MVLHIVLVCLFSFSTMSYAQAQTPSFEGVLTYKADILKRLVSNSGQICIVSMKVYTKGQLTRQELIAISEDKQPDTIRATQIRNDQGIFLCLENSSQPEKMAILMSYKEEEDDKKNRTEKGNFPLYIVEKTGQYVSLMGVNTERVLLKGDGEVKSSEALISTDINVPVGLFYESLSQIKGTPLQFTEQEYDWLVQYTIVAIEPQTLSKQLFEVDSTFMIIPMKQMQEMGKKH